MAGPPHIHLTLHTAAGALDGQVHELSRETIVFEVDGEVAAGRPLPWRVDLPGWGETVSGSLVVEPGEAGCRRTARITGVDEADRELFETWLSDLAHSGASGERDRPGASLGAASGQGSRPRRSGSGGSLGRAVRDDQRDSDTSSTPAGTGRRAIREALRASLGHHRGRGGRARESGGSKRWPDSPAETSDASGDEALDTCSSGGPRTPSLGEPWTAGLDPAHPLADDDPSLGSGWLADVHSLSTAGARAAVQGGTPAWLFELNADPTTESAPRVESAEDPADAATEPAEPMREHAPPAPDPQTTLDVRTVPATITVTWREMAAFARDYRQHLRGGGLFVPFPELGTLGTAVQIRMLLPAGQLVQCTGHVVAPMIAGCGIALHLLDVHRAALAVAAI